MAKSLIVARDSDEVREMLTDRETLRNIMSDPETAAEWIEGSINARLQHDNGIGAQVKEQTEAFMVEWLKNHTPDEMERITNRLNLGNPNARNRIAPNTVYNKHAVGAKHDGLFDSASDLLYNISEHSFKTPELSKKLGQLQNDLSSIKPSDGGFLIPETLRAELLRIALERAVVRSRARVIPMDTPTLSFPTIDETSHVSSVYGGVIGYWTDEGATLTESQPKFGRVKLEAHKLALYTEIPNELLRDARPALAAFIGEIFPEAISWFEDIAFTVGGGVGEPLGYLNAPAAIAITRTTGTGHQPIDWADIVNMYCRMLPQSLDRAVWIISPDALNNLLTMPFTVGGTSPIYLGGPGGFPSATAGPAMSLLGRPVIVSEKARALGTAGDINFVDFGFYLLGDMQAMSARQSEDYKFQNDVTAFRVIERLDGRPWLRSAITPQNGSANTLSPFVKLANA